MKTLKGIGLLTAVLTLFHGLYLILHSTWARAYWKRNMLFSTYHFVGRTLDREAQP